MLFLAPKGSDDAELVAGLHAIIEARESELNRFRLVERVLCVRDPSAPGDGPTEPAPLWRYRLPDRPTGVIELPVTAESLLEALEARLPR